MKFFHRHIATPRYRRMATRRRGAAAILAMMFLVIFSSLAAAMAIVSQGNLATADSYLKMNRSLAAAETGMKFMEYRINKCASNIKTTAGVISSSNAPALWNQLRAALILSFTNEVHNISPPQESGTQLTVGPISVGPGAPTFTCTMTPHPIAGENYNSAYYQRPPYSTMTPAVSNSAALDSTWVRVKVTAADGPTGKAITRSIQMDFKLDKKIRFAVLSKSRVMIGRNVMIQGPIGSRFEETDLPNGHPVQMVSDFAGLDSTLDSSLNVFVNTLKTNDVNGDNRINLADSNETAGITSPEQYDKDGDGFIADFDFFLAKYDTNADKKVSAIELDTAANINTAQLLSMVDSFGDATRSGYNDGFIDSKDRYAKVRGQILITADKAGWEAGAAGGTYENYLQGPVIADSGKSPLTFEASDSDVYNINASDFDVTTFRNLATGDMAAQATTQAATHNPSNPSSPKPLGTSVHEAVPYGAAHPYDYYDRPVYENMTFTNVKIPKGSNALFKNCKFVGVTFVETSADNVDPNFNYAGMQLADGTQKHPDKTATVNGSTVTDTKTVSNNVRFDGCTFEGAVVSDSPSQFTQVRNKIAFTGTTKFDTNASSLSDTQKALFKRSTLLAPNMSVEMGSFIDGVSSTETVNLSGAIVAGVIDMRGQVKINGLVLTTFEPISNTGPVIGETSPQFNTTLGYFASAAGDLEAELPSTGVGVIQIRYDPKLALPDGISSPIELRADAATYFEGGG